MENLKDLTIDPKLFKKLVETKNRKVVILNYSKDQFVVVYKLCENNILN